MATRRNRLLPWYIGIVIVVAAVVYTAVQMVTGSCPAPTAVEIFALGMIPIVYLVLMYLTFVSQE